MKTIPIKGTKYRLSFPGDPGIGNEYSGPGVYSGKTEDFDGEINYGFHLDDGDNGDCFFPLSTIFTWED